jgi:hypothetical protein
MKRILDTKLLAVIVTLLFTAVSCTQDFEEINTNTNNPGTDKAAPDMLLTNAIESMTDRVHEIFLGHEMGSGWVQHMAKVQYTDEDRYVPRIGVINNTWSSFYAANGMDAHTMIKVAEERGHDSYKGVGLVVKCYIMSVLTDLFGDVPYTEAFRASAADGGILSPAYDTQESIYTDLIAKLDEANTLIKVNGPAINGDILYNNDLLKWKKFANSLRLRLLLRMSDRNSTLVTNEMTKMLVTNAADYPIFTSNADNASLAYLGSSPNNNPINENRKTRDDHRVSATLIDIMYTNNVFVDWRVVAYAELAEGPQDFVGLPNGLTSAKAAAYNGNGLKNTSKLGSTFTAATAPGVLMTYAELQFILAEAVQRNFITGSTVTAQQYYTNGIAASYNEYASVITSKVRSLWGATNCTNWFGAATPTIDQVITHYMNNGGAWNAANALQKIRTERWIAMFGQGLQAWFEWRRTNTPVLVPAEDGMNGGKIPVRVYYPSDESARNKANLDAAVARQGADDLNTRVWWDVANNY